MLNLVPRTSSSVESAFALATATFSIAVPIGVGPAEVLAGATGNLSFDDGVTLVDSSGITSVGNGGNSTTSVGVATMLGSDKPPTVVNVYSIAPVSMSNNAVVTGNVWTTKAPAEQAGAVIKGALVVNPGPFITTDTWTVDFPATQSDVDLEPGKSATLPPGAYRNVAVKSRASLTLQAGTYTFASLDLEPQGVLSCDTSAAPLLVYVQNSLLLHSSITTSGGPSTFLLAYAGSSPVAIETAFSGTFVSPNAAVTLASLSTPAVHSGSFFGASVEFGPHTTIVHAPFPWSTTIPFKSAPFGMSPILAGVPNPTPPPPLNRPSDVPSFLQWAYQAQAQQVGDARSVLVGAAGNEAIAAAIADMVTHDVDLGRNLVQVAILGELRTQAGFQLFQTLLNTPLRTTGTFAKEYAVPLEQIGLTELQARAVDGVAMMLTPAADGVLLRTISTAQSNIVLARAVSDFLFIHGTYGRTTVSALLTPDQQILMDRFSVSGSTTSYNDRLATYLAKHPEVLPPPIALPPPVTFTP